MTESIRVTVWGENVHERQMEEVRRLYPEGMHTAIAGNLKADLGDAVTVRTATLEQPEHGLTEDVVSATDVLLWWGHVAHEQVSDEIVGRIQEATLQGMGLIVLHSAHESKIFRRLMGTSCSLRWRDADDRELVWTVNPAHPIAAGVPEVFALPLHEMYGEYFDIPQPDELVFLSSYSGGEVFRSGCCFTRGAGRIFYFSPGHETYPIYANPHVRRVIANAVRWSNRGSRRTAGVRSRHSPSGWIESAVNEQIG
jgi:trehalose utilization protein